MTLRLAERPRSMSPVPLRAATTPIRLIGAVAAAALAASPAWGGEAAAGQQRSLQVTPLAAPAGPAHPSPVQPSARQPGQAAAVSPSPSRPAPAELPALRITASRAATPEADPSASVTVVGSAEMQRSAARTLDDILRRVPGFSLFRRLGSGAAHPTAQGVSLRGIGPSGTSRALVLVDGVPFNDPFGGWISWSALPVEPLERVEVLRGAASSLWGNYGMGGVVGVATRRPVGNAGAVVAEGGERGLARTEAWTSRSMGNTSAMVDGRWIRSGDYPLVRADARGPIDEAGGSVQGGGGLSLEQQVAPGSRLRFAARGFHEQRDNGTPYATNETKKGFLRVGGDHDAGASGVVSADAFGTVQEFSSRYSSVSADRTTETPAADQYAVPSSSVGGSVVWTSARKQGSSWLDRQRLTAGVDSLWVQGTTRELARYLGGAFTRRRVGSGSQAMAGAFVEDRTDLSEHLHASASLRLDWWRFYDGVRREDAVDPPSSLVDRRLGNRQLVLPSPRVGLWWDASPHLVLRTAAYRGFRAPTLNEQLRPFRVRNDLTEANAALDAEKLVGVEAGLDFERGPWRSSLTGFWNRVDDPIFNVTVGSGEGIVDPCGYVPAGGVCRQRRNLGSTSIPGLEAFTSLDLGHGLSVAASYLWSGGEVRSAPGAPALEGNRLPQVPRHQGTFSFDWDEGGPWRASVQVRVVGRQFDDDENTRELGGYATVDAYLARSLGRGFEAFVAAENLMDQTIESAATADGVVSIAAPRLVRAGLRYRFGDALP